MKHESIAVDPAIMVGKPVIKGTRILVEQILRESAEGMSFTDILDAHPRFTMEDIEAALQYGFDMVHLSWELAQAVMLRKDKWKNFARQT